MTVVFLDANVLVPITLTNVLLTANEEGLFQAHWSPEVVEEAVDAIADIRPGIPEASIRRRFDAMNSAFEDGLVSGDSKVLASLNLPDPDDRHVVAAAIAAEATIILTENLKDFPEAVLKPFGLVAMTPDQFLSSLLKENGSIVADVIRRVAQTLVRPPRSVEDILIALERTHVTQFARDFRAFLGT